MAEHAGTVIAICVSERTGTQKQPVDAARLVLGHGVAGDAHAGTWHRQVSLLAQERVDEMRAKGLALAPGAFGENIVTGGFDLAALEVGRRLRVGEAVLQVTQLGKECHDRCPIYFQTGDCIMPRFGVFARVRRGGWVRPDDPVALDPALDRLRYAVVTLSDRRGEGEDRSGPVICELLEGALAASAVARRVLPDERAALERELVRLCDEEVCDLVVTTGGTGLSPRDVTPEATAAVIDREVPGMAEAMRAAGLAHTPHAMLSRAVCGLRGSTLIVNLSGSPRAAREQLEAILPALPHAIETASGVPQDCAR